MKEKASLTTMTITYPIDDDNDLPFESADNAYYNNLHVSWSVVDPEYDREPEPYPWETHDYTDDYDYPYDYTPDDDEEFE